ncbi:MAG TPA: hypothetical protein VHC86_08035 [Opitutaceae bacterium]|nr:hypothetical protein [Opitutaceae bacterium]
MKIALIDNGSLEPSAHRHLRAAAAALSRLAGRPVEAVSWRHSDRIDAAALDGAPARTLGPWVRAAHARGEREFVFAPFLVSAGGAIGSSIRADVAALRRELGFGYAFTAGFAPVVETLAAIVAARAREAAAAAGWGRFSVIVVDHGGPARASAELRDAVSAAAGTRLGGAGGFLAAASMESPEGPGYEFNRPLLADLLADPAAAGPVIVVPLFLAPGRHAGPGGDLTRIAGGRAVRFAGLVGTHPLAAEAQARNLRALLPAPPVL